MRRTSTLLSTFVLLAAAAACSGTGGERQLPASPTDLGDSNAANLTAPVPQSPSDDQQLDTTQPTLRVANASSNGSGARSYEFQIADNNGFAATAGVPSTHATTISLSGVPEGSGGTTSFTPPAELLPTTRYFWRARALQGTSVGPWSNTARFRTKVDSFKSGNQAFDILTNGRTAADETWNVSLIEEGAKLNGTDAYLTYRLTPLPEGEISFIGWRTKPGEHGRLISMQDGTGDFNSNAHRVRVEKRPGGEGGKIVFQFMGNTVESGSIGWLDNHEYYFKLEWRGGTARFRVYNGANDAGGAFVELSVGYSAPYNAANPVVSIGSRSGDTYKDVRISRVYVGQNARPVG